jgi:hypothetical protein
LKIKHQQSRLQVLYVLANMFERGLKKKISSVVFLFYLIELRLVVSFIMAERLILENV